MQRSRRAAVAEFTVAEFTVSEPVVTEPAEVPKHLSAEIWLLSFRLVSPWSLSSPKCRSMFAQVDFNWSNIDKV